MDLNEQENPTSKGWKLECASHFLDQNFFPSKIGKHKIFTCE